MSHKPYAMLSEPYKIQKSFPMTVGPGSFEKFNRCVSFLLPQEINKGP